jgi:formylglycine-generating enzyme required for sulfatase activity
MKNLKSIFIFLLFLFSFLGNTSLYKNKIPYDRMILIPKGDFLMGDSTKIKSGDPEAPDNPGHMVHIDSFYIDRYEVTNAEFKSFVESGGYYKKEVWSEEGWLFVRGNNINAPGFWDHPELGFSNPDKPVVGVTYYEAEAFANWMGKRLPTEAEWEYAARGVDGRIYPWGNDAPTCDLANYFGCSNSTSKVGSFPKGNSPFGVSDMAGNAFEWVKDVYDKGYYLFSTSDNPQGPKADVLSYRIVRGGSYLNTENNLVTYNRVHFREYYWDKYIGFRCARSK